MSPQPMYPAVTFHTVWWHRAATLTVSGEIDITTAGLLRQRLTDVLGSRPGRLTIDLSCVRYIDVAGTRAIAEAARALPPGSPLVLRSPAPIARRVFQLTGLDHLCVIEAAPVPPPDRRRAARTLSRRQASARQHLPGPPIRIQVPSGHRA